MIATDELQQLLGDLRPAAVLAALGDAEVSGLHAVIKAEALRQLDRMGEAVECLEPQLPTLQGDVAAYGWRVWADLLLLGGRPDAAILAAGRAASASQRPELRAAALAWAALGYGRKQCWSLATSTLHEAIALAPNDALVLTAQARMALTMDQRVEARAIYERMATLSTPLAVLNGQWGLGSVAFLLGSFDEALRWSDSALERTPELIGPLFLRGQLAHATANLALLDETIAELERRSPQSLSLPGWREFRELLSTRLAGGGKRLEAFPTTIQRRDYCGPCVIELVLRYWQGGLDLTNDQIAGVVKIPGGGTPPYRMREFFHLVGFDTVRCRLSAEQLRGLIDAGYPAIIEESHSNSSHVAVVIGYNSEAGTIDTQDPVTHAVTQIKLEELAELRLLYGDSALVAFPEGDEHQRTLARLHIFDDPAIELVDQAALAVDDGRHDAAIELLERAVQRRPDYQLPWAIWLSVELERWREARAAQREQPTGLAARFQRPAADSVEAARERFYAVLGRAKAHCPDAVFVAPYEGTAAMLDGEFERARDVLSVAHERDAASARIAALLADCHHALRDDESARTTAQAALLADPALSSANVWMARSLIGSPEAADALHYARCAAALAPDWWMVHLALAEALLESGDWHGARREIDVALAQVPRQPEVLTLRAILLAGARDFAGAAEAIETALASPFPLAPYVTYQGHQLLCRMLYQEQMYGEAAEQVLQLLALHPDDPWAMQFRAAARSRQVLLDGFRGEAAGDLVRDLYAEALQVNAERPGVAGEYLSLLAQIAGLERALKEASEVRMAYPGLKALAYLHGRMLADADRPEEAAQAMLEALSTDGALTDRDELYAAVRTIVAGFGPDEAERAIAEAPLPEAGYDMAERMRALGLLFVHEEGQQERARELLTAALEANPEDALSLMRLGELEEDPGERERIFRRALLLAPSWPYGRWRLANELIDNDHAREALEYTTGHEDEDTMVLEAHARALLRVGRFEDAAVAFGRLIEAAAEHEEWLYTNKWYAEHRAGLDDAALATAQQAAEIFAENPGWLMRLGQSLYDAGQVEEARAIIERGREAGAGELAVLDLRYEIAWGEEQLDECLALVEEALPLEEHDEDEAGALTTWLSRKLRVLSELDRDNDARAFADTLDLSADGWGSAAWEMTHASAWALCYDLSERALAIEPQHFAGLFTRAAALAGLNREEEALAAYHHLRDAHPDEHNAYEKLGLRLAIGGSAEDALQLAERAVALGSFCPFSWATRGYVHFVRGDHADALSDLRVAWNRADVDQRRESWDFWWVLAALEGDAALADERRKQAFADVDTDLDRRMLAQIDQLLAQRAGSDA